MPATGYIQVRAYTSTAQYPLADVAISVTSADGTAIAMRLTNRNGMIIPIEIPDIAACLCINAMDTVTLTELTEDRL